MSRGIDWWDTWFVNLARYISTASKDPSTQTGAVIVDNTRRVISTGYNGFPVGIKDDPERYADRALKYQMIVHCERNALLFAREALHGACLFTWPFMSCSVCAAMVIQSGITRCVAPEIPEHLRERWAKDMALSAQMFEEAGIELKIMPLSLFC